MRTTTTITATIALTTVLALGACGTDREPIRAEPGGPTTSASEPPERVLQVGETGVDWCDGVEPSDFTGDQALLEAAGGTEGLHDIYCHALDFLGWGAYNEGLALLDRVETPEAYVEGLRPWLTEHALGVVRDTARYALDGNPASIENLRALVFVHEGSTDDDEYRFRMEVDEDSPLVGARSWGEAEFAASNESEHVTVTIPYTVDFLLDQDGEPWVQRSTREYSLHLVPTGMDETPWLIDGWESTVTEAADPTPEAEDQ